MLEVIFYRIGIFLCLCCSVPNCFSQDCVYDDIMKNDYSKDAAHLALLYLRDIEHEFKDSIDIPKEIKDDFLAKLSAIAQLSNEKSNAIFNEHCIHHFDNQIFNHIIITLDQEGPIYPIWSSGQLWLGHEELDDIFEKYNFFELTEIRKGVFELETSGHNNLNALLPVLRDFKLFEAVDLPARIGDGNIIECQYIGEDLFVNFTLSWADCITGCIYNHSWQFLVDKACQAAFLSEKGDEIPPNLEKPMCNLINSNNKLNQELHFKLFPNPNFGSFLIRNTSADLKLRYELFDIRGSKIMEGRLVQKETNIEGLSKGVYVINIYAANNSMSFKKIIVN